MPERRVNELSPLGKRSDRLILEEHSHCEVPAGCGGVVLRWRDPAEGLPVELWLLTAGEPDVYVDADKAVGTRPILSYGPHVLAVHLTSIDIPRRGLLSKKPASGVLMFAAVADLGRRTEQPTQSRLVSAADCTWKYAVSEPSEAWIGPEFDDTGWKPLLEKPLAQPGEKEYAKAHRFKKLTELGAAGLATTEAVDRLWIRKRFTVTPEGLR